jgi:hypothetical protein
MSQYVTTVARVGRVTSKSSSDTSAAIGNMSSSHAVVKMEARGVEPRFQRVGEAHSLATLLVDSLSPPVEVNEA